MVNAINKDLVRNVLLYLENLGWTELIDSRWKNKVVDDIKEGFPNIDIDNLNYILNLILV